MTRPRCDYSNDKQPQRHKSKNPRKAHGRGMAIATLWICGVLGLFLIPMLVGGIDGGIRTAQRIARSRILKFPTEQFVIHSPERPWIQVDSKKFGPFAVVGFAEPGPITAMVMATNLGPAASISQFRLVDWFKESERRANNPWRILSEGIIQRNGATGWQFETLGFFQGHEIYGITWVVTTNGFGYILRASSPSELRTRAKQDADYIFSRFAPMSAVDSN